MHRREKEDKERLSLYIHAKLYTQLEELSKATGKTKSQLACEALANYLKMHEDLLKLMDKKENGNS